jgi:hypothetical protein
VVVFGIELLLFKRTYLALDEVAHSGGEVPELLRKRKLHASSQRRARDGAAACPEQTLAPAA